MWRETFAALSALGLSGCLASQAEQVAPTAIDEPAPPAHRARGNLWDLEHATWRHVGGPVSTARFEQDKFKCKTLADMAPVGEGTPEVKMIVTLSDCMRGTGYEPVYPPIPE